MAKSKADYWLTEDGLILITAWARNGLTEEQIATNMGITRTTLTSYKNKYSSILNALKRGKEVVDFIVENALYKRATGYTVKEKVTRGTPETIDGVITLKNPIVTITERHIPPDTTACIYWNKNRKRHEWKDKWVDEESEDKRIEVVLKYE